MTKVPVLSKEEIQKMICGFFVGSTQENIGFILQKLGPKGLEEYNDYVAKAGAVGLRGRGVDNPLKFAMDCATFERNVLGCEVEVKGDERRAVLDTRKCTTLETAMELKEKGAPFLSRREYCVACIDGYFKRVAKELVLKLSAKFTKSGCEMTITR